MSSDPPLDSPLLFFLCSGPNGKALFSTRGHSLDFLVLTRSEDQARREQL